MLKLMIYAILYILLFREIYAVVLHDLYGEDSGRQTEHYDEQKRAARRTDRPQEFMGSAILPRSLEIR